MAEGLGIVASDVDGTLVMNWDPRGVDPRVFDAVRELARRGVRFVVASGRQYLGLRELFAPVADEVAYVCENGALAFWGEEVVVKRALPRELALEACRAIAGLEGCELLVSGERVGYVLEGRPAFLEHMRRVEGGRIVEVARPEDVPEDFVKVAFYAMGGDAELERAATRELRGRLGEACSVVTSGTAWVDVVAAGADKASALLELGRLWGVAPERMAAFGDNENDRGMLDLVGRPYLVEGGAASLRGLNERLRTCRDVADELWALLGEPGAA